MSDKMNPTKIRTAAWAIFTAALIWIWIVILRYD